MKIVMGEQIFAHELDLLITPKMVETRYPEWHALTHGRKTRSEEIQGYAAFMGIELMEYGIASAQVDRRTGVLKVKVRSAIWQKRQE